MSIAAANVAYVSAAAPTKTGQIVVFGGNDIQDYALGGTVTAVLDGASTTFTVNWIDGTQTLNFTPSRVFMFRCGGTGATTISAVGVSSVTNASATVTISAAGTNTQTVTFAILIQR